MAEYTVVASDGKTYRVQGPEGLPEEIVRMDVDRRLRKQLRDAAPPPEPAPIERTITGRIGEVFRGIPRGAVGLLETAAVGASALLPEELETSARERIASIGEAAAAPFQPKPGYEDSISAQFGEAAGSFVPFLAAGPFGLAGRVAATGLGAGAGAGTARERAEQGDATPEERAMATGLGSLVGLSEVVVPFRILGNAIGNVPAQGVLNRLRRAAQAGGEEGLQEAAAEVAQNLIERGVYNPEQGAFVGTGESFGYGAGVGGLAQGLFDLFAPGRDRGVSAPPAAEQAAETEPVEPVAPEEDLTTGEVRTPTEMAPTRLTPPEDPFQTAAESIPPTMRPASGFVGNLEVPGASRVSPSSLEVEGEPDRFTALPGAESIAQQERVNIPVDDLARAIPVTPESAMGVAAPPRAPRDPFEQGATVSQQTSPGVAAFSPLTTEDLDAAKVPKNAPVRKRVVGNTNAAAVKADLQALATNENITPAVAASVKGLADSIVVTPPTTQVAAPKVKIDDFISEFSGSGAGTYVSKLSGRIADAKRELAQGEEVPQGIRASLGVEIEPLQAEVDRLEALRPLAQRADDANQKRNINKAMLSGVRQELDVSNLSQSEKQDVVEEARKAASPEEASQTILGAIDTAAATPAVTAPEQEFRAKVARVISNADQAKLADAYQTVVGEAPPVDLKAAIKKFSLPEQVAIANEFNSIKNRPLFELPSSFEEKTSFSMSGAGSTVEVNGKQRSTTNSNGQPLAATEDGVRAFWRWFGDSKVVDAQGRPLVIYRGLNTAREEALSVGERSSYANFGSNSPYVANSYANPDEPFDSGGPVLPLYLKADKLIEFPVSVSSYDGARRFDKFEFDRRAKSLAPGEVLVARQVYDIGPRANLKADPERRYSYPSDVHAWNRGVSVKSAVGNTGAFDPNSPQINQALGAGSYSTDLFPYISDFDSALNAIVKYASNPAQREIAQKLAARIPQLEQLGFEFSLKVTQDGYQITGGASGVSRIRHYQLGANTSIEITLNHPSNGVNSGTGWVTVAHEIAHAATQAQLTYAPQGTAAVQLRALFNDVVSHFNERVKQGNLTAFEKNIYQNKNNALGNPDELLAWGLTDPEMQQWLDSIKSKNGSFLSRLFDVVASALGFSNNDTAFSELLSISDNLLTESFVPYIEAANARGKSFGRQENLTNHPTWALWAAEARPIVWSAPDAALIEAETLSGNTIYILATPQGTTQVDVSKYTGKMLPPARLKLIQKIAAGLTKTSPSMNKTAQVAEEVIFNDTPQSNSLFLKTQGAQLNSTSKPMRSKPVRDAVANIMGTTSGSSAADAARAVLTWGLPLPALNDYVQSYMRKKGPAYELFADAMQRFTDTAVRYEGALREFTDSITAQIARMGEWKTNNPELYDAMTNLYFGASHAKVDLTKPESEYAGNPEKLSAYKRLKKDFIAIGGSGQAIYRQMRAIHNRQFKQISQQVFDRVYADTKDKGMATRVRDAFVEQMRAKGPLEGYAPMLRPSGKHMLKYVIKGEDAFEIFTNPNDRAAREQQLLDEGVKREDIKPFLGDKLSNFDGIVPSSFLGQLVGTLKEVKVDDATRDALIESVMTLGVAMSPPNSVLERLASRKEIAGYVRDPFWAFQEGTMGLGRKLINMQYGAKLNNEKRNMQDTRKNIGDDPIAASILNDVSKRANYAANPSQAWWSNAFTTATYGWTLGFNVSSAIVDMSSLVLVTGPYLTRTYGWAKTHRAMMQSAKEIMGMGTSADVETLVTQGLEGAELQEVLKTMGTKERDMVRRKTSPSMLNINFNDPVQAKKYGYLKPLVDKVRESGHSERYSELSESAEFGESNLLSKWSARMGFMMNASERFKREIGIKAAYDLELSTFGANPTPEQMAAAAQKAMETSLLLNGGSTAVTGARFQQNDIFRIAFMYRRFAALQMYLQAKTAYDSTLNDNPDVRKAARKFAGYTMLTSAAFVGVKGMPMMGTVAALWAMFGAVFGEEDEDNSLDNFLRTYLDPILVEGIPNILFNANVAGRMEMTNLLIRDSNLPNDATLADGIAAHFGGPTYGSISRAIKGAELIADGEIQRGVENMLPASFSNVFKSARFLSEGAVETLRDDVVVEVNPLGALAQALGFAPADYARAMDFNIGQSNAERRISDRRTGLYEAVYTAYRVGDTDGVAQAMQAIIEFNQRYPEFAITTSSLKQSISGRDRNTRDMVMGRLPSARTRGVTLETAEDWGF